jgi:hypothetical protein
MLRSDNQDMAMRPLHPNDVATQADVMKRGRDVLANSIAVANSVGQKTNAIKTKAYSKALPTHTRAWRPEARDDFSFGK